MIAPDRRIKPRIVCDYPVILEGDDGDGNKYNENARLTNLSACGLFLKANRKIEIGSILFLIVFLSCTLIENDTLKIATNGIVLRTEPQVDGACGIAVKFNKYRFL